MAIEPYRRGSLIPRPVNRAVRLAHEGGLVVAAEIEAMQYATQTALLATGSVSALETNLIQTIPLGEPRYKMLGDAFAMGAMTRIYRMANGY